MGTRGWRRHSSGAGELAGGQRLADHQGQENVRSRPDPNQRRYFGDIRSLDHAQTLASICYKHRIERFALGRNIGA
jgi:hypothetical protein